MSDWISVKERLPDAVPDDWQWVLVYADGAMNCMAFGDGKWSDWTAATCHNIVIDDITHWMPLPEPPDEPSAKEALDVYHDSTRLAR